MNIIEPTTDQCTNKELVFEDEHRRGFAVWYPQMGGYAGKAVALLDKRWTIFSHGAVQGGCIDVLVWHDGEFPFDGDSPRELHHCDPQQFIDFGEALAELNEQGCHEG